MKITIAIFALLFSCLAFGEASVMLPEDWKQPSGMQHRMSLYARVAGQDGQFFETTGTALAVFDGKGLCRGYAKIEAGHGFKLFHVIVGSNATSENGLVMKILDAVSGKVFSISESMDFVADTTIPSEDYTMAPMVLHVRTACLDIDGSDNGTKYVLTDVRLIFNYINGGKAANATGDTRMLAGTTYKTLSGAAKAEAAARFREAIGDMADSLDIDGSDNGTKYVLTDVRLIYNYINGGKATTATGDTRMLAGTPYKTLTGDLKALKAAEFRNAISEMIE